MTKQNLDKLEQHYLKLLTGKKPMKSGFARIINLLKKGSCTVCTLPHYRFAVLACTAHNLKKIGWAEVSGKRESHTNYVMTEKLKNILNN